jgi:hypothetical protein
MASRELSRYALKTCAAAPMLAGCGGWQRPIGSRWLGMCLNRCAGPPRMGGHNKRHSRHGN